MLNIKFVVVGKIKEKFLKDAVEEYQKRLSKYVKLQIIEVEDSKIRDNASLKEEEFVKEEEGIRILKQVKDNEYMFLFDLHGEQLDSLSFAGLIDKISSHHSAFCFVIGGSLGFSKKVIERANYRVALSKMTFTHQMTRVIALEQIYRSFKILNNEIYHK